MTRNNNFDKALVEASQWVARESAGNMNRKEQAELDAWLEAAPDHLEAYGASLATSDMLDNITGGGTCQG